MLLSNPATYDLRPLKEAASLTRNGFIVTIFAWDREGELPRQPSLTNLVIHRFNLRSSYGQSIRTLFGFALFYFWCFLKSLTMNFRVIHCHDVDTLPCGILLAASRGRKVQLVYDMHDHPSDFLSSFPKSKTLVNFVFILMRRYVDQLVVVNDGFMEYFVDKGFDRKKITVIMNVPETVVNEPRLYDGGVFRIFYYGSLSRARAVHNLIRAVELLPDVTLLLAGNGELVYWIKKQEETHHNISYLGWLSNSEIDELSQTAHLIPSIYLPSNINHILATPGKFFTSIACGIPVLAPEGTYMAILVQRYECGLLIDAMNFISIREAIRILMNDKNLYNKIANNGIRISKELFNWNIMEKRLLSMYMRLETKD